MESEEAKGGGADALEAAALQRIANNEFNQELAREKLDLERRRQALREKQASASAAARAEIAAAKEGSDGKKDLTTDSTDGHGCGAEGGKEEPFRLWTPAELADYQPMVQAALREHPFLRKVVEAGDLSRLKETEGSDARMASAQDGTGISGNGE